MEMTAVTATEGIGEKGHNMGGIESLIESLAGEVGKETEREKKVTVRSIATFFRSQIS